MIGPSAPSAAGSSYVAGDRSVAPVAGREPPPRPVEIDQDLLDGMSLLGQGGGDRGPGHDRDVVLGRRPAEQDDDRRPGIPGGLGRHASASQPVQSPTNSISKREVDAVAGQDLGPDALREAADVRGTPLLVVDDEVGVLLRDDRAADPGALEPGRLDQSTGRVAVRIAEDAPGRRQAERLVGLTPVADLVETGLDRLRVRLGQPERGVDDHVTRAPSAVAHRPP